MGSLTEEEPEEQEEGAPAWMVTFADMVTLLLTFFVLLLSFANTDTQKFKDMLGSLKDAFGTQEEETSQYVDGKSDPMESMPNILDMKEREKLLFFKEMVKLIKKSDLGKSSELEMEKDGLRLRVKGQTLFKPGSAELSKKMYGLLDEINVLREKFQYSVVVEGHTDNIPIKSKIYPSNWELSASRAISVIRYFMETLHVSPAKLQAVGYAATKPLVDNSTKENRAKNRRVEFKFEQPILKKFKKKVDEPKILEINIFERNEKKRAVIKQFQEDLLNKTKDLR
ncbi:flagellar motor protein MotB [Thermodesulfobacteriota bacterium]